MTLAVLWCRVSHKVQPTADCCIVSQTRWLCPLQGQYLSVDFLADCLIILLAVLWVGRTAFRAFQARRTPLGGRVLRQRSHNVCMHVCPCCTHRMCWHSLARGQPGFTACRALHQLTTTLVRSIAVHFLGTVQVWMYGCCACRQCTCAASCQWWWRRPRRCTCHCEGRQ